LPCPWQHLLHWWYERRVSLYELPHKDSRLNEGPPSVSWLARWRFLSMVLSVYYHWIPDEGCSYIKQWMTSRISSQSLMLILRRMWLDRWWLLLQHLNLTLTCQWYSLATSWNLWGSLSLCCYQFQMVCQINREGLIVPTTWKYQWSKCSFWKYFVFSVLFLLQHREGGIENYFIRD